MADGEEGQGTGYLYCLISHDQGRWDEGAQRCMYRAQHSTYAVPTTPRHDATAARSPFVASQRGRNSIYTGTAAIHGGMAVHRELIILCEGHTHPLCCASVRHMTRSHRSCSCPWRAP